MKKTLFNTIDISIRKILSTLSLEEQNKLEEIRLRANSPLVCIIKGKEIPLYIKGISNIKNAHIVTIEEIRNTLKLMSNYSIFSIEEQLKKGFFTLKGGHRVGVCGKVVMEKGEIITIKDITSLNIRVCKEIIGCSNMYTKYILENEHLYNTLIISPPNNGKTTLLRDIVRNISNRGVNVVVIDERSEIGGTSNGEVQCDLGYRCDVLDSCEKVLGMTMAIRSMSPKAIVVDELGTYEDIKAVYNTFNSGVKILGTCHSESFKEFKNKKNFENIVREKLFDRYIVLINKKVVEIYNKDFEIIFDDTKKLVM